jgi:dephospho-CoA kinase
MKIIGITGSSASGKTTLAKKLSSKKKPVWDADKAAHRALEDKNILKKLEQIFSGIKNKTHLELRLELAEKIFSKPALRKKLEKILHPHIKKDAENFIRKQRQKRFIKNVILDIPLLFEAGYQKICTHIIHVETPIRIRKKRLEQRGFSKKRIAATDKRMWRDSKRKKHASKTRHRRV